ncbi:MAG TPA: amidase [Casimicrobiaceae bacterium]|nr:amidase [Casimicrobiaceae bacterium]
MKNPQPGPNELGLVEAAAAIRTGSLRSTDLVEACLERIDRRETVVGAWAHLDPDAARAAAHACDRMAPRGPLHGIPLAVKDIIDTVGMPTELGSPIYRGRRPAWDAACVALVKRAGAIILGKTVTTEFAYFAPGKTANPRNLAHTPGGSSSGSAAAVADFMAPAGFATQTAASIIRPASFCGVVGYKPSFGTFSLAGIKPFAESLDTLGTITRSVADARLLWCALLGVDYKSAPVGDTLAPRVGLCRTPWWNDADADSQAAVEGAARRLADAGATVSDAVLPTGFAALVDVQRTIMAHEGARSYAYEYDAHRGELSPQLRELIAQGLAIERGRYLEARARAARAAREFGDWIRHWDIVLAPAARGEAPEGLASTGDPIFSRVWTLLGLPSITLPGFAGGHGLPIGVQLVAGVGDDERLLALAEWVEARIVAANR